MTRFTLDTIAIIRTCFPQKFAIPRQPSLAPSAKGVIILEPDYSDPQAINGLEQVSHLWLTFIFHQHSDQAAKLQVRPPRLGGNKKLGVFATRSSFRPNYLGLSVVKLDEIKIINQRVHLLVSGVDMVDGTPVVDIKPYLPYVDTIAATNAIAQQPPTRLSVIITEAAQVLLQRHPHSNYLRQLIVDVLAQDPRPAYHPVDTHRNYQALLLDVDVCWVYENLNGEIVIKVIDVRPWEDADAGLPGLLFL